VYYHLEENCLKNHFTEVHICGLGIHCPLDDVMRVLDKMKKKKIRIIWHCGDAYLDEFRPELGKYCICHFDPRTKNNALAVYDYLYPEGTEEQRPNLIRHLALRPNEAHDLPVPLRPFWEELHELEQFLEAAIWRFINYRDYDTYPHAIRVLAEVETMNPSDRKLTLSYSREHNRLFLGRSKAIKGIKEKINKYARSDSPVIITGETGTGKETVARLLHVASPRSSSPFVPVNCATLTEDLLEDRLFGHKKGAFTGAIGERKGIFEVANKGTVFLDEISELPSYTQPKLLRILQDKKYYRVGEDDERETDIRIIVATNRDLRQMVSEGRFRDDLYYRLAILHISIPPLRERPEDIPILVSNYLYKEALQTGRKKPLELSKRQMETLTRRRWRGNVRELFNILERWCMDDDEDIEDIFDYPMDTSEEEEPELLSLKDLEMNHIRKVFAYCEKNISRSAKVLGIQRNTLKKKLEQYEIR
jgi:transcriptional regulator with PAS, ATPase and Fis domain